MHMLPTPAAHHILHQREAADGRAPWAWTLAARQATTLAADAAPRWLHVDDGCVWLTRANANADLAGDRANDIWLLAGDSLALPAGSAWVLEAWPQARLSLLLQAPAAVSPVVSSASGMASWLARWLQPSWLRAVVASAPAA